MKSSTLNFTFASILKKLLMSFFALFFCFATAFASPTNSDDSFAKIQEKNSWIIGLDDTLAPMGFKDDSGQIIGFDIDLAKEVAKRLGIKVVFQPCVWDTIFLELQNKNIDTIWNGVTINSERESKVMFSRPYISNKVIVLTKATSPINKLSDLTGKKIAAQSGSPAVDYIKQYKGADFSPSSLKELVQYPDNLTAFFDLSKGGVDAVVVDEQYADYYMTKEKAKFKKVAGFAVKEQDGIAFRKDDIVLRNKVQAALDAMIKDGTATVISKKWFGRDVFQQ